MFSHHDNTNISIQNVCFSENHAVIAGSSLYGGLLDRCTVSHLAERNIDNINKSKSQSEDVQGIGIAYLKPISNIETVNIGSPPVKVCFCENNKPNCSNQHPPIFTKREERVTVPLAILDEVDNVVRDAEVYGFLKDNESGFCCYESRQMMNATCSDYSFLVFSIHATYDLVLYTEAGPCEHLQPHQTHLKLEFPWCNNCPIGFQRFDDQEIGC